MEESENKEEIRFAKSEEYGELLNFIDRTFQFEKDEEKFISILPKLYRKKYDPCSKNVIIRNSDRILGAVGLFPFTYELGKENLSCAVIGNVGVEKESRGRGYMRQMMEYCLNVAKEREYDFVTLGGRRQRYELYGFQRLGYKFDFTVVKDNVRHCLENKKLKEVEFKKVNPDDRELLKQMFELYSKTNVKVRRYESNFYDTAVSWSSELYAVMSGKELVGYFIEGKKIIHEIVLKDSTYFYGTVKQYMKDHNCAVFKISPCDRETLKLISAIAEHTGTDASEMYRIYHTGKVAGAFLKAACKERKLADGKLPMTVHHEGYDEKFTLEVKNGEGFVNFEVEDEANTAEFSEISAEKLLFSYYDFDGIREKLPAGVRSWLPLPLHLDLTDHG